jgi:hypothetical protein
MRLCLSMPALVMRCPFISSMTYFLRILLFPLHSAYNIRYYLAMSNKSAQKTLLKARAKLLVELGTLSHLLHGSWVERYSVCSRANCKCHRGERHGPRHYLVVNEAGRQRQKYIPNSQADIAVKGIAQYRRLQEIADQITQLNLALLRENAHANR